MTTTQRTEELNRVELADSLDRIAAAFGTLSRLVLDPPSGDVLNQVRDAELLNDWPSAPCPETRDGVRELLESAATGETEVDVRQDFNRLFIGPERMAAPPYESVHRSEDRLIFEQETFLVRAAYAEFDLAAPNLNREPDDHIGLEMAFVGELCVRGLDALDTGDDVELDRILNGICAFLEDHLLVWGPQCMTQVLGEARTAFYRGVGSLGLGALADAGRAFRR